jgi:hypothetical protein
MTPPKYIPGDQVSLSSHSFPGGPFKILQSIRSDGGEAFYRVRSDRESFERVVAERQILRSTPVARSAADAVFAGAK